MGVKDLASMAPPPRPVGLAPFAAMPLPHPGQGISLLQQAQQQYPGIQNTPVDYRTSYGAPWAGGNMLESWPAGEPGDPAYPRPASFGQDKFGVEVFDPTTRPIDVVGDIVSHQMVHTDPVIKEFYSAFKQSMTPQQHSALREQYKYAKTNEGETRSYDDWANTSGLPAYFRGYPFQQWSDAKSMYTPAQISMLDSMVGYLKTPPKGK